MLITMKIITCKRINESGRVRIADSRRTKMLRVDLQEKLLSVIRKMRSWMLAAVCYAGNMCAHKHFYGAYAGVLESLVLIP